MIKAVLRLQSIVASLTLVWLAALGAAFAEESKQIEPSLSFDIVEPGVGAGGIASDGKSLWISAQSARVPGIILQYSFQGKLLNRISLPNAGNIGGGLAHDGKHLYVLDYRNRLTTAKGIHFTGGGAVWRLQDNQLKNVADIPEGQVNTCGLAWINGKLYYGNSPTVQPKSTIDSLDSEFKRSDSADVALYVRGLASDGETLWCSDTKRVYQLDAKFRVLKEFTPSVGLADLEWSDGSLWGVENNKNRVHRFSIVTEKKK